MVLLENLTDAAVAREEAERKEVGVGRGGFRRGDRRGDGLKVADVIGVGGSPFHWDQMV